MGSIRRRSAIAYGLILALFCVNNFRVLFGQTRGDDEPTVFIDCQIVLHRLAHLHPVGAVKAFSTFISPPLRYLLDMPGQALFPHTVWGPRLLSVLLSLAMVYAIVRLGQEVGGPLVGYFSGLLIAASSVFTTTSVFAWSAFVLGLAQALRLLRRSSFDLSDPTERRRFVAMNAWLFVAFLESPSALSFVFMTFVFYVMHNIRARPRALARALASPVAGYSVYHLYFWVVVPLVGRYVEHRGWSVGQLGYTLGRGNTSKLGYESFLSDLRGLNAHFFPFLGWALVAAGLVYVARRERRTLLWLAPHTLLWGFYFAPGTTQGYFMVSAILLLPYGVAQIVERAGALTASVALGIAATSFALWSVYLFVRVYPDDDYPHGVLTATYSEPAHIPNIVEPFARIRHDLYRLLPTDGLYVDDIDDGFAEFYDNPDLTLAGSARRAGRLGTDVARLVVSSTGSCDRVQLANPRIRIVLTKRQLCADTSDQIVGYPHSLIHLYVLKRS